MDLDSCPQYISLIGQTGGNFTLVIDDGSHLSSHQIITLEALWPSVAPGG